MRGGASEGWVSGGVLGGVWGAGHRAQEVELVQGDLLSTKPGALPWASANWSLRWTRVTVLPSGAFKPWDAEDPGGSARRAGTCGAAPGWRGG